MLCPKCHSEIEAAANFCGTCGQPINSNPPTTSDSAPSVSTPVSSPSPSTPPTNHSQKHLVMAIISFSLAIITNLLFIFAFFSRNVNLANSCFLFNILFVLTLSIIAVVFSAKAKKQTLKNAPLGLGLSIASLALTLTPFLIDSNFNSSSTSSLNLTASNPLAGDYDCYYTSGQDIDKEQSQPDIEFSLTEDLTFSQTYLSSYQNGTVKGTYSYEKEHKTSSDNFQYYLLTMRMNSVSENGTDTTSQGVKENQIEFGLTNYAGKREGMIIFVRSSNMYYCYEK